MACSELINRWAGIWHQPVWLLKRKKNLCPYYQAICKTRRLANWLRAQSSSLLLFVNKVLLEHSHNHSFSYRLWLLSLLLQWQSGVLVRDHLGHKTENSYYLILLRKNMPTPTLHSTDSQRFHLRAPYQEWSQEIPGTAQNNGGRSLSQPAAILKCLQVSGFFKNNYANFAVHAIIFVLT